MSAETYYLNKKNRGEAHKPRPGEMKQINSCEPRARDAWWGDR